MAQQKRTTTKKQASKKPANTTKKPPVKRQEPVISENKSNPADYFHAFSRSRFFKPVVTVLAILVVFGIDLLISLNHYDKFFKIMGIEIILVAVILVIILAISTSRSGKKETTDSEDTNRYAS